jgi:hypothetical protein
MLWKVANGRRILWLKVSAGRRMLWLKVSAGRTFSGGRGSRRFQVVDKATSIALAGNVFNTFALVCIPFNAP